MADGRGSARPNQGETTVDRVYEQVKAMAITFEFPPGGRVNELAVARRMGVSRTPLREALNRLTADGFLTFSRQQGFFRKPLSVKTVEDLYEWREQIERGVIRLVIERASEAELDEIEAFVRSADAKGRGSRDLLALDERFYERLAAMTDNIEILACLRNLNDRIRFVRWVELEGRRDYSLAHHGAILDAVRRRDLARAERLVSANVLLPRDRIVAVVKDAFARIYMNREDSLIPPV